MTIPREQAAIPMNNEQRPDAEAESSHATPSGEPYRVAPSGADNSGHSKRKKQADKLRAVAEWFTDCKTLTLEKLPVGLIAALEAGAQALDAGQEIELLQAAMKCYAEDAAKDRKRAEAAEAKLQALDAGRGIGVPDSLSGPNGESGPPSPEVPGTHAISMLQSEVVEADGSLPNTQNQAGAPSGVFKATHQPLAVPKDVLAHAVEGFMPFGYEVVERIDLRTGERTRYQSDDEDAPPIQALDAGGASQTRSGSVEQAKDKPRLAEVLCWVSQIFNGWRGFEEWSKWDEEVAQAVVNIQRELDQSPEALTVQHSKEQP